MREVQSCDFCGDDAVGTFEVVPDDLLSSDADQRRVALCDHCRTTLEGVLEPFRRRDAVADEDADVEPTVSTSEADGTRAADADRSSTSAAVDPTARAEGIAIGREGDSERSEALEGDQPDESDPLSNDGGGGVVDERVGDDEEADDDESAVGEEPDQFRTVMRLLSNREFPVDRAEFEELTAGAYELEDDHVARILDHAVDRGVVVDDAGTLKKQ